MAFSFGKSAPKNAPEFGYGLPGAANILGEFDPAGFMTTASGEPKPKLEVYRLREAELAHGRVSMLASLGFLVQEKFHPLFSGDGGPAIDQIPALPFWLWIGMTVGIGRAELYRRRDGPSSTRRRTRPRRRSGRATTRAISVSIRSASSPRTPPSSASCRRRSSRAAASP